MWSIFRTSVLSSLPPKMNKWERLLLPSRQDRKDRDCFANWKQILLIGLTWGFFNIDSYTSSRRSLLQKCGTLNKVDQFFFVGWCQTERKELYIFGPYIWKTKVHLHFLPKSYLASQCYSGFGDVLFQPFHWNTMPVQSSSKEQWTYFLSPKKVGHARKRFALKAG